MKPCRFAAAGNSRGVSRIAHGDRYFEGDGSARVACTPLAVLLNLRVGRVVRGSLVVERRTVVVAK